MASHLVILGDRDAVAWVVTNQKMAFTADRAPAAMAAVAVGDEIFLYSTRSAFHSPVHDRGRVFGVARAVSGVVRRSRPLHLVGRDFTHELPLNIITLARPRSGADLSSLIPQLQTFPNKKGWQMKLRRPLLTLVESDSVLLRSELQMKAANVGNPIALYAVDAREWPGAR